MIEYIKTIFETPCVLWTIGQEAVIFLLAIISIGIIWSLVMFVIWSHNKFVTAKERKIIKILMKAKTKCVKVGDLYFKKINKYFAIYVERTDDDWLTVELQCPIGKNEWDLADSNCSWSGYLNDESIGNITYNMLRKIKAIECLNELKDFISKRVQCSRDCGDVVHSDTVLDEIDEMIKELEIE